MTQAYLSAFGRRPTRAEWETLLVATLTPQGPERAVLDSGTVTGVELEVASTSGGNPIGEEETRRLFAALEEIGWNWKENALFAPSGSMYLTRVLSWTGGLAGLRDTMVGRSLRIRSTLEHEGDDTGGPESLADVRGLVKVLDALVGMETDEHALQWEHVWAHYDLRVRAIAERASREPSLRRLFPYAKLSNVGFSTSSEYPYDALAYVLSKEADDEYEARAADHRPLAEGGLEVAIQAVIEALRGPSEPPR